MPHFVLISKLGTAAKSSRGLSIFPKMQSHNHIVFFFIFQPVLLFFAVRIFTACDTFASTLKFSVPRYCIIELLMLS